jgi:hypothetical protein
VGEKEMDRQEYEREIISAGGQPIFDRNLYERSGNWDSDMNPTEEEAKLLAVHNARRDTLNQQFGFYGQRIRVPNTRVAYKSVGRDGREITVVDNLPTKLPEMAAADCGHVCHKVSLMTTAHGTSCPDCYDRKSE